MPNWYLEQASTYAGQIDNVILIVLILAGIGFIAAEVLFFWLIWKFRASRGRPARYLQGKDGTDKTVKRWVTYPHFVILFFDVVIIVFSVIAWRNVKMVLPEADSEIRVIGQQWAWTFQHPGLDNELDTEDDIFTVDELHIEVDKVYHFHLESRDALHSFSVPVFRLKQDAIPGRSITGWFEATNTGVHDIQCAEICGIGHGVMRGRIHIEDANRHSEWLAANSTGTIP